MDSSLCYSFPLTARDETLHGPDNAMYMIYLNVYFFVF